MLGLLSIREKEGSSLEFSQEWEICCIEIRTCQS